MVLLLVAAFVAVGGIGFAIGHLTGGSSASAASNPGARGGFARASLAPARRSTSASTAAPAAPPGSAGSAGFPAASRARSRRSTAPR